jgi:hypothetical protein
VWLEELSRFRPPLGEPSNKGFAMLKRHFTMLMVAVAACCSLTMTGCFQSTGPTLGIFSIPIPVSPYWQKNYEDKFHIQERYARVPILGPITSGGPAVALDPPSDDEVWWALERARPTQGGIPFLHETQRNGVTFVKEKIVDYVDPPRVIPLIGPAQLHHAHYKCTAYFSERKIVGWPFPHTLIDEDCQEVLYIDHNHFHMCGNVDFGPATSNY